MKTPDEFVTLLDDELGLTIAEENLGDRLDEVPGWDSVLLLSLLSALQRETGRPVSLARALEASSLEDIYRVAVD